MTQSPINVKKNQYGIIIPHCVFFVYYDIIAVDNKKRIIRNLTINKT